VPLVKPSEFFDDKNKKSSLDSVKEDLNSAAPEKLETISEAYDSFKTNLNQIQKLSNFTETLDNFKIGLEKVNLLSDAVEQIKIEIQDFAKKEDLEESIMSQLFFVEESLKTSQSKIKTLNSKTLFNIKEEFDSLSLVVENFISTEVPLYKKLITESETRVDDRFSVYKESVASKVDNLSNQISKKFEDIAKTLTGINENSLDSIKENISLVEDKVDFVLEKELPRYKKIFAETELKTEERLLETENKFKEQSENFENLYLSKIENLREDFDLFVGAEIPKFKNTLVEFKLNAEDSNSQVLEKLDNNIRIIKESFDVFKKSVEDKNTKANEALQKNIFSVENFINESKEEISSLSKTYENLYKDFKNREISENKKLEGYSDRLDVFSEKISNLEKNLTEDVNDLQNNLDISTTKYYDILKKEVGYFEQNILDKVTDLEINFVRNEKHIQNTKDIIKETLSKIKIEEIEKKNNQLLEKISKLELILEKFDEKQFLSESLTEPPSVKNSDPLTPLDKNYVTIKDLQDHYRIFINRVQQQLASIGGGGAGFIKDLSDVNFDEISGKNKLLIYNGTNWVGIASTSLSGSSNPSLISLSDVDSSNLGDGRFLRYNASTSEFTFSPVSASNLELIAGDIQSGILTTSGTGSAVIMSISASTYRSANYQVQVTEGTNYNMTTINVIHDGTNTYMTEYGTINQPIGIATFSTDINGGSLRLLGHPAFASSTTFKVIFTAIEA
jgi:hypothetical protein